MAIRNPFQGTLNWLRVILNTSRIAKFFGTNSSPFSTSRDNVDVTSLNIVKSEAIVTDKKNLPILKRVANPRVGAGNIEELENRCRNLKDLSTQMTTAQLIGMLSGTPQSQISTQIKGLRKQLDDEKKTFMYDKDDHEEIEALLNDIEKANSGIGKTQCSSVGQEVNPVSSQLFRK